MKTKIYAFLVFVITCFFAVGCGQSTQPTVLRVAIPYSDYVLDPETNYYINWLENETGLAIEPITVRQSDAAEYLELLFDSNTDIDIVLFGDNFEITEEQLLPFIGNGDIYQRDNGEYYFPNYGRKTVGDCGQILWINSEWLKNLGLSTPTTTNELYNTLKAFKEKDPNGNGKKDEIPLIGSTNTYATNPCELILNCFVYNDPYHNRLYINQNGEEVYNTGTDAFKHGVSYLHKLYDEGLLDKRTFTYSKRAFTEMLNGGADIVGAFTTDSISDVIYPGNPEIMAKFIHVAPIEGPAGERNALKVDRKPVVGAIISNYTSHAREAEMLLDTMISKDASLIARYGEEGVDWEYSDGVDVSIYRTTSTIVTKNYIWNTPQNKHLNGIGAMYVPDEYLKGVTWNGVDSDSEYIDARAQMSSAPFLKDEISTEPYNSHLAAYADKEIIKFIIGEKDIDRPYEWIRLNKEMIARSMKK